MNVVEEMVVAHQAESGAPAFTVRMHVMSLPKWRS
jgi:hypothetical protein